MTPVALAPAAGSKGVSSPSDWFDIAKKGGSMRVFVEI